MSTIITENKRAKLRGLNRKTDSELVVGVNTQNKSVFIATTNHYERIQPLNKQKPKLHAIYGLERGDVEWLITRLQEELRSMAK